MTKTKKTTDSMETIKRWFRTAAITLALAFSAVVLTNQNKNISGNRVVYAASNDGVQELTDNTGVVTIDNIKYSLDESGKFYSVIGYDKDIKSFDTIEIENEINNLPVSKIGNYAFEHVRTKKVIIPPNIKAIEDYGFYETTLDAIEFSEGLESIGKEAFIRCNNICEVKLPKSLRSIGSNCFDSSYITKINVPGNVSIIPYQCFNNCIYLEELIIEKGVEQIEAEAFAFAGMKELLLPNTIKIVCHVSSYGSEEDQTFIDCSAKIIAYKGSFIEDYLMGHHIDHEVIPDPDYPIIDPNDKNNNSSNNNKSDNSIIINGNNNNSNKNNSNNVNNNNSNSKIIKQTKNYKVKRLKVTKSKKNKTITVKFKKDSRFNYKVSLSNNKNFKKSKTKVIKGKYRTKYTFKKKSGKYNYVSVVAYRKINGKTYFSKKANKKVKF